MNVKILVADLKKASVKNKIKKSDLVKILARQKLSLDDISLENPESYYKVVRDFLADKYAHTLRVEQEDQNQIRITPTDNVFKDLEFILKKQGYHPKTDAEEGVITIK